MGPDTKLSCHVASSLPNAPKRHDNPTPSESRTCTRSRPNMLTPLQKSASHGQVSFTELLGDLSISGSGHFAGCGVSRNIPLQNPPRSLLADDHAITCDNLASGGPIVPRPREGHRRRFSEADKRR